MVSARRLGRKGTVVEIGVGVVYDVVGIHMGGLKNLDASVKREKGNKIGHITGMAGRKDM